LAQLLLLRHGVYSSVRQSPPLPLQYTALSLVRDEFYCPQKLSQTVVADLLKISGIRSDYRQLIRLAVVNAAASLFWTAWITAAGSEAGSVDGAA